MQEKTTYSKHWEKDLMDKLYKNFSVVVRPFEIPLVDLIIKKSNEIFENKTEITMFEIGAGSGNYTSVILNGISSNRTTTYKGIDISPKQKELFGVLSNNFPKNVFVEDYVISSWQEYQVTKKYDLIIAQHSWYGIREAQENFDKLKEILADGGVCFITLNSKNNISHIAIRDNGEQIFNSEDLESCLINFGFSFEKITLYNDDYTKESFCKGGKLTQHGIDHFSFSYRKELHGDEQNVIDMINSAPEEAFRFPTDLFVIRKYT